MCYLLVTGVWNMKTTPVRVWSGVYEALQIFAKAQKMDASTLASIALMQTLMSKEELPEKAKEAIVKDFFEALGTIITESRGELAKWAMLALKQGAPG
jgi:hypothetical protein